jgi:hypothetical protein
MAPAAITDVCPHRAAHGALAVRVVQVTPAANAREPTDDTKKAHVAARASPAVLKTAGPRRATGGPRQARGTHKPDTHTHERSVQRTHASSASMHINMFTYV